MLLPSSIWTHAQADVHASRAFALARTTGRWDPFGLYQILPRVWYVRGKLGLAAEMLEGGIEAARLQGTPPALAGNLFNRSVVAVAVGDLDLRPRDRAGGCRGGLASSTRASSQPGPRRGGQVLLETGQATRAVELLVGRAGGEELALIPGGWRAYCLELLTRCYISLDRPIEAERTAHIAEVAADARRLPLASAWANRAAAAVALYAGDTRGAIESGLASAAAAEAVGAPIEAALSRTSWGEPSPRPTSAIEPSRSCDAHRRRSTPAALRAIASKRSDNWGGSACGRIAAPGEA